MPIMYPPSLPLVAHLEIDICNSECCFDTEDFAPCGEAAMAVCAPASWVEDTLSKAMEVCIRNDVLK
jgi:hypothetical protein